MSYSEATGFGQYPFAPDVLKAVTEGCESKYLPASREWRVTIDGEPLNVTKTVKHLIERGYMNAERGVLVVNEGHQRRMVDTALREWTLRNTGVEA